jgi:hypothetical protein
MTKSATTRLLIVFHAVVFGAVFLRIDTFPLTWVPMYSQFHGLNDLTVPVGNMSRMNRGFKVTRASGQTDYVGPRELNIPNANFRRIYYERAFGVGPPKHRRERVALNPFSNWVFDLFYADPAHSVDWEMRILSTLNRSQVLEPEDADFIVQAEGISDFATFSRETRRQGDLSTPRMTTRRAELKARSGP